MAERHCTGTNDVSNDKSGTTTRGDPAPWGAHSKSIQSPIHQDLEEIPLRPKPVEHSTAPSEAIGNHNYCNQQKLKNRLVMK